MAKSTSFSNSRITCLKAIRNLQEFIEFQIESNKKNSGVSQSSEHFGDCLLPFLPSLASDLAKGTPSGDGASWPVPTHVFNAVGLKIQKEAERSSRVWF